MIKENHFQTDLAWSHRKRDDEIFDAFYRRKFDGVLRIEKVEDLVEQKKGIDKRIHQTYDRVITVDEKKRRTFYGDILVELFSTQKTEQELLSDEKPELSDLLSRDDKTRGWAFKNNCDFIVYAVLPLKQIYLVPNKLLTVAMRKNWRNWCREYGHRSASNRTYWTVSVPVPVDVLFKSLVSEMTDKFSTKPEVVRL